MLHAPLSRRTSEVIGVALFAVSLIWLVALVTYAPTDPVWFFSDASDGATANLIGPFGAFVAIGQYKLSYPVGLVLIIGFMLVLTALLVALCWWKGEPARWRWGDDR